MSRDAANEGSRPAASATSPWKLRLLYPMALFYCVMGVLHFVAADAFVAIMPAWLPWHLELVWLSGLAELALGLLLLPARTRTFAAWGLVLLLVAVFPANVNMALHEIPVGHAPPRWVAWGRLPLQALLIAWAYGYTRPRARARPGSSAA